MQRFPLRVVVYFALLWCAVAAAIMFTERSRLSFVASAIDSQTDTDRSLWDIVHKLGDDALVSSVADYTFWDDMAEFAEGKRDLQWAKDNLDPGLDSFGIDALWVLSADGSVRYSVMADGEGAVAPPPLPMKKADLERLVATIDEEYGVMHEFYWLSDIGPLTVVGSDITSTDDPGHLKPSRGYYFAARRLLSDQQLERLTSVDISISIKELSAVPPNEPPTESSPHAFWHPMEDYAGNLIGAIRVERYSDNFQALLINSLRSRDLTVGLWLLTGVITSGLILTLGRTQLKAAALAERMTLELRNANTTLEERVRERTAELEEDVKRRTEAEQHLKKRTEELERMNKVMIDRELRVVELKRKVKELGGSQETS